MFIQKDCPLFILDDMKASSNYLESFCVDVKKCNLPSQQAITLHQKVTSQCIVMLYNFKKTGCIKLLIRPQKLKHAKSGIRGPEKNPELT